MGMAASQARYLALVARKSNCEFEGQQINQARTALSNQSANLFNQMLGLKVPTPPSTSDFKKTQYSYTDGARVSTIDSWQQLGTSDPEYNYVVTHHYYVDQYTGSMKKLSDPQVQFPADPATLDEIQTAETLVRNKQLDYAKAVDALEKEQNHLKELTKEKATLTNYAAKLENTIATYEEGNKQYKVTVNGTEYTYKCYSDLTDSDSDTKAKIDAAIAKLKDQGALPTNFDTKNIYYNPANPTFIAFKDNLDDIVNKKTTDFYSYDGTDNTGSIATYTAKINQEITDSNALINGTLKTNLEFAKNNLEAAEKAYKELSHPTSIGNCKLTPLASLSDSQAAEIEQIVKDMKAQGIDANISKCFNEYGEYTGGIYQFQLNGVTYYTTYDDLKESYDSGTGSNQIDGQTKLSYYNATYVSTKVEKTEKALLETDGNGRFTSVKFESDSVKYTLSVETITDDVAYQDAMNEYNYQNQLYDKAVRDINAQTSIIQQEDQQLELRLKQLDTEQNALKTEIEAVQKIVKDNVESSFKTFSG